MLAATAQVSSRKGTSVARIARLGAAFVLGASAALFVALTIHWPLIGDPAIQQYAAFLATHGMAPYRQIADINLPGSFLLDIAVIHTLGGGALAWRVFDLLLLAAAALAMMEIAQDWFAGLLAGVVFAAIHGADGIFNLGQRDFVIAVLVVAGYAALFRATRRGAAGWVFAFGLCAGAAATIKPTFVILGPLVLLALGLSARRQAPRWRGFAGWGVAGWLIPCLGALVYLVRERAVSAFLRTMTGIAAYHASLARQSFEFLLLHSVAPLGLLVVLWIAVEIPEMKTRVNWERLALLIGLACGLFSYVAQGKGYPYQRYPLLALLLVAMVMDLVAAARKTGPMGAAGWVGVAYLVLVLAPCSVWRASRYDWRYTGMVAALDDDLSRLGGPSLSGQVQCIDTVGGCYNSLYDLRIVQHTGFLYDEFLFGPGGVRAIAAYRRAFWNSLVADPPRVVIVVEGLFPSGPHGFQKLKLWPEFDGFLAAHYVLYDEVTPARATYWWARRDPPRSYRIYLLKQAPATGTGRAYSPVGRAVARVSANSPRRAGRWGRMRQENRRAWRAEQARSAMG